MEFIKVMCDTEKFSDIIMVFSKDKEKTIKALNEYAYQFEMEEINCSYEEYLESKKIQFIVVNNIATIVEI